MMASVRVWPRPAAVRNVVQPPNDPQPIEEVRTETDRIEATARPAPSVLRKTHPAGPSSVRVAISTKRPTAPPERRGVRETKLTEPPVGAVMTRHPQRDPIAEVATTAPHETTDPPATTGAAGMTVPRARNPRVGAARMRRQSPLVGQPRVPTVETAMSVHRVGTHSTVVAMLARPSRHVPTPRVPTEAPAMTGLRAAIATIALPAGMIAPSAVTTLPARIGARRSARRETLRAVPNRARPPRLDILGRKKTSNPKSASPPGPSRKRSMPRLGNTRSPC